MDRPAPEDSEATHARRRRVLQEVVETEATFVANLNMFVDGYVEHFRLENSEVKKSFAGNARIAVLFSNLAQIQTINADLLARLRERVAAAADTAGPSAAVGDIFTQFAPLFALYAQYTANHAKASQVLHTFETQPDFLKLMEELSSNFVTQYQRPSQSIGSYLIMPVQRVPRYRLLLLELYKYTPTTHADREALVGALGLVEEAAMLINETIRSREEMDRLIRMESMFVRGQVSLAQEGRRLVKEGPLIKRCRNSKRTYHFHLFNDLLLYSKARPGNTQFVLHRRIELVHAAISIDNLEPGAFAIASKEKSFVVFALDDETKQAWVNDIKECIRGCAETRLKSQRSRQSIIGSDHNTMPLQSSLADMAVHAKVWVPDQHETECMACGIAFTVVRRRHHCRKCGILVCDACSPHRLFMPNVGVVPVRACDKCAKADGEERFRAFRLELHLLQASVSLQPGHMTATSHTRRTTTGGAIRSAAKRVSTFLINNSFTPSPISAHSASMELSPVHQRYAKVFLNERLYGQTETEGVDEDGRVLWGGSGVYFDIAIPRLILGVNEAGTDLAVRVEVYDVGPLGLSDLLIATSTLKPYDVLMRAACLRETIEGVTASRERRDGTAGFQANASPVRSGMHNKSPSREMRDGTVDTINPMVVRQRALRAHEIFPSEVRSIPAVRRRPTARGDTEIVEVCGRVDVSVGIVVPMALEEHKTALGVAGWMEDAVAEHWQRPGTGEGGVQGADEGDEHGVGAGHALNLLLRHTETKCQALEEEEEVSDASDDEVVDDGNDHGPMAVLSALRARLEGQPAFETIQTRRAAYVAVLDSRDATMGEDDLDSIMRTIPRCLNSRQSCLLSLLVSEDGYTMRLHRLVDRLVTPALAVATGASVNLRDGVGALRKFSVHKAEELTMTNTIVALNATKQILTLHSELLKTLTAAILTEDGRKGGVKDGAQILPEPICVGPLFEHFGSSFRMYSEFATNFEDLTCTLRTIPEFSDLANTFRLHLFEYMGITEYTEEDLALRLLNAPLKRLEEYQTLLNMLIAATPSVHNDHASLVRAVAKVNDAAVFVAQTNQKRENKEMIVDIEDSFVDEEVLLTAGRIFIRSGPLVKVCRRENKEFYFWLFNDLLLYGHYIAALGKFKCHRRIFLTNCQVVPETIAGTASTSTSTFTIHSDEKSFVAMAPGKFDSKHGLKQKLKRGQVSLAITPEEIAQEWIQDLQTCISIARPSQVMESSTSEQGNRDRKNSFAPVWKPDRSSTSCQVCDAPFNLITRRRHHCRQCGALCCAKCSTHRIVIASLGKKPSRVCKNCAQDLVTSTTSAAAVL